MRWTKRLKVLRISKIIIPIALAVSLVFAGFAVFAKEADNFVLRVDNDDEVLLSLTLKDDLTEQTDYLLVPTAGGRFEDATYIPNKNLKYEKNKFMTNLPDDIAMQEGVHHIYQDDNKITFYSFSFYLVNNSKRAVDVDMVFNIDSIVRNNPDSDIHVDDAVRIMLIVGENQLLSDNTYEVYKKPERNEENQQRLDEFVAYNSGTTYDFLSDICIFEKKGDLGFRNLPAGGNIRFTIVMWLEGWDAECIDPIKSDSMKMSIDFKGY